MGMKNTTTIETGEEKVTIYKRGAFGISKIEAKRLYIKLAPWAQYRSAVQVSFLEKGKRKEHGFVDSHNPSTLVLAGWGHIDPDSSFLPEEPGATPEIVVSKGRYGACDPRWQSDFDAKIAAYLEASGARVIADYRGHDTYAAVAV